MLDERANFFKVQYLHRSMVVYTAGISGKVNVHYPGRSAGLHCATVIERWRDGPAEVSRGHSRSADRTEGPNMQYGRRLKFR